MKRAYFFAAAALALALSACGDGQKEEVGGGPHPEKLSPAARCLRQHPSLRVRSFPSPAAAAEAFFRATVDCDPSDAEAREFARWLEASGVTITESGVAR